MHYEIAPSILAADFSRLGDEVAAVIDAGADLIHFDVMDNHFVPNLTIGPPILASLRKRFPDTPIDVHLMTSPPDRLVHQFLELSAHRIAIHPESTSDPQGLLEFIRQHGVRAGIVLNPDVPIAIVDALENVVDFVLVMSVYPGFGGQKFIQSSIEKIRSLSRKIAESGQSIAISVDGGISLNNIRAVAEAGATTLVAGSSIFQSSDYRDTISRMRKQLPA